MKGRILDRLIAFLEAHQQKILKAPPTTDEGYDGLVNLFRKENKDTVTLIAAQCLAEQSDFYSDLAHGPAGKLVNLERFIKQLPVIKQIRSFLLSFK